MTGPPLQESQGRQAPSYARSGSDIVGIVPRQALVGRHRPADLAQGLVRAAGGIELLAEVEVTKGQVVLEPGVGGVLAGQRLAHRHRPLQRPDRLARTAALAQDDADSIEALAQLVL